MKDDVRVSVIVPVYNIKKYVRKCLNSLILQSYKKLEIVVVDDGSMDGSSEICDEMASKDKRVRVFHRKNGGLSSARNYGIRKARGEFVCLVDGDDYVKSDFVEVMIKEAEEKNADIVVCGYNAEVPTAELMSGKEAAVKLLTEQENMEVVAWNKMYRRELFKNIRYPEGRKHEDALTTYKMLAEAREVVYVPRSLYYYVRRDGSIMDKVKLTERLAVREQAAVEAISYFAGNKDLKMAAEIALLTAKYAFVDAAARGEISKQYFVENAEWIKKHQKEYDNNKYMTKKLKLYNLMLNSHIYGIFRKIRHE